MRHLGLAFALAALLLSAGCAKKEAPQHSGLLTDYTRLQEDTSVPDSKTLIWHSPDYQLSKYDSVIIEPIQLVLTEENQKEIDMDQARALTGYFQEAISMALQPRYKVATTPGPTTLRLRLFITELVPSNPTMNTITTIVPFGLAASLISKGTTGKQLYVGETQVEGQVFDSETNTLFAEFVSRKTGDKYDFSEKGSELGGAEGALKEWSEFIRERWDIAKKLNQ